MKIDVSLYRVIVSTLKKNREKEQSFIQGILPLVDGYPVPEIGNHFIELIQKWIEADYEMGKEIRESISHYCWETDFGTKEEYNKFWYNTGEEFFFGDNFNMMIDQIYLSKEEFIAKYK